MLIRLWLSKYTTARWVQLKDFIISNTAVQKSCQLHFKFERKLITTAFIRCNMCFTQRKKFQWKIKNMIILAVVAGVGILQNTSVKEEIQGRYWAIQTVQVMNIFVRKMRGSVENIVKLVLWSLDIAILATS